MPFSNMVNALTKSPLVHSLYSQEIESEAAPIPPSSNFITTEGEFPDFIDTEDGNRMITE